MNPFVSEFNKTVKKAIERYAKELGKQPAEVQLLLGLKPDGSNLYKLLVNFQPKQEISFNNILGVKIDFSGKAMIVPGYLKEIIQMLSEQNSIEPHNASVIIYMKDDDVKLHLYKLDKDENEQLINKPVKKILLEELFG